MFNFILAWRYTTISELMINERIRDKEIRVIGEEGQQLGVMSPKEAMKLQEKKKKLRRSRRLLRLRK